MGFSAILGLLAPIFTNLIQRIFPDPEKQAEAQIELQKLLSNAQIEADKADEAELENKKDVITAEMSQGGWASQWRSYLMIVCISIVAYNWVVVSLLNSILKPLGIPITPEAVPPELWTLVTVGLGGYLTKETVSNYSQGRVDKAVAENSAPIIDEDKLAKALRSNIFKDGMTEAQWQAIIKATKDSVEQ